MTKKEKVEHEIKKLEIELERLKTMLPKVKGSALKMCDECGTKNKHWYTRDVWTCSFC